jgi:hypothetical protein
MSPWNIHYEAPKLAELCELRMHRAATRHTVIQLKLFVVRSRLLQYVLYRLLVDIGCGESGSFIGNAVFCMIPLYLFFGSLLFFHTSEIALVAYFNRKDLGWSCVQPIFPLPHVVFIAIEFCHFEWYYHQSMLGQGKKRVNYKQFVRPL